jgi:acyl dehydratase
MSNEVTLEELKAYEGRELAPSQWVEIGQQRIDQFADCTEDRQYIHVDPLAMKDTPMGCTIAHGFLSLSLMSEYGPLDWPELEDCVMKLNYGLDRVRFINPVKVNSRVRFRTRIVSVTEKSPGRVLIKAEKCMEIDGEEEPAMIAETLGMLVTTAAEL